MMLLATEATGQVATNELVITDTGALALSWLLLAIPLLGFVTCLVMRSAWREQVAIAAIAASVTTFVLSVAIFFQVQGTPATHLVYGFTWLDIGPLVVHFDVAVDQLTAVMLLVVTGVGSLVHIYSWGYMYGDERFERYFAYLNLFLFSMLVLVVGSSFLTLFVGWELVGLSSYLLIGFWFEKGEYAIAAKKAFITNRVGDVAFMIAMFMIFREFGSLEFSEVLSHAAELSGWTATTIALLLMGGAAAKSAQIPLYVWLPDAMAGPTPVSALIHAATMVTAGVYLMARSSPIVVQSLDAMTVIAWVGVLTALLAAVIAIRQDDIKKILAYSTVSQLGYMFVGIGTGGFNEGIFHLVTHAFFKGLLFLAAGSVMHALANQTDVWRMGGLRKVMPITFWTSAAAWLAISGVFPFAGFFSKDQILTTAYEHGFTAIWVIGVLVAIVTAFYMSRWFFLVFLGDGRWGDDVHPHESPASMTGPLIVLGVLSLAGGAALNFTHHGPFFEWLDPATASVEGVAFAEHGALTEGTLIAISLVAAAIGILLAWFAYNPARAARGRVAEPVRGPLAELAERKFFVDELYEVVFVRAGGRVADAIVWFDKTVIDGLVNGAGTVSLAVGDVARRVQTGFVRSYLAAFLVGGVVLIAVLLTRVGWT
jgi:NADH-quinone oxidoreductase subunit L